MKELTAKLQALGLSEEMAAKAITTVAEFVKSKLPESCHSMIDDVLAGKTPNTGGLLSSIQGLFSSSK